MSVTKKTMSMTLILRHSARKRTPIQFIATQLLMLIQSARKQLSKLTAEYSVYEYFFQYVNLVTGHPHTHDIPHMTACLLYCKMMTCLT